MIKRGLKGIWRTLAFTIIGIALLLSLVRFLLPTLSHFKPDLEALLSRKLKADVTVESVEAQWRGFGPELIVRGIAVRTPDTHMPVLTLAYAHAAMDIVRSVISRKPVMQQFELNQLHASVEMNNEGHLTLPGLQLDQSDSGFSADYLIDVLLRQHEVAITETHIQYRRRSGDKVDLDLADVRLNNFSDMHQALGALKVENGGSARFVMEFNHYPLRSDDTMSFYLESKALDLSRLPIATDSIGFALDSGTLDVKLWSYLRDGAWRNGDTRFSLNNVDVHNQQQQSRRLEQLTAHLWFERTEESQWRLHGDEVVYQIDNHQYPEIKLQGRVRAEDTQQDWALDISAFALTQAVDWLRFSSKVPIAVRENLLKLSPEASVPLLQLDVKLEDNQVQDWAAAAQFEHLHYQANEQIPSVQDFSGRVMAGSKGGAARLQLHDNTVDLKKLFRAPLQAKELDMALNWRWDAAPFGINLPYFYIQNDDGALWTYGRIDLPEDRAPEISLVAYVKDGNVAAKSTYIPSGITPPDLLTYLDNSVLQGQLTQAWAILRGPINEFPFNNTQGMFAALGDVSKAEFRYQPDWPLASKVNAELQFTGNSMDLAIAQASLQGIPVTEANVAIPSFSGDLVLHVSGNAVTDGVNGMRYLNSTPLKTTLAPVLANFDVLGSVKLQFGMDLPLSHVDKLKLQGDLSLQDNSAHLLPVALPFEHVTGHLQFNERGLQGGSLEAQTLNGPANAQISSDASGSVIAFQGSTDAAAFSRWMPNPVSHQISGPIVYQGELNLLDAVPGISMQVRSDMHGFRIDLPEPLGKPAEQSLPATMNIMVNKEQLHLSAQLGDAIKMEAIQLTGKPWIAELLLGNEAFLGDHTGFTVRAHLAQVDAAPWIAPVQLMVKTQAENEAAAATNNAVHAAESQSESVRVFLHADAAQVFGFPFKELLATGASHRDAFDMHVAADKIMGDIVLPNSGPIVIKLAHLEHEMETSTSLAIDAPLPVDAAPLGLNVESFPDLVFDCARCRLIGRNLGSVHAEMLTLNGIKQISVTASRTEDMQAQINGSWSRDSGTQLQGQMNSNGFGDLLRDWQLDLGIKETTGSVDFSLYWSDSPFDFSVAKMRGNVQLHWKKGYIASVSDAEARLFSLLSLQSLTRRLSLDFSDLYKDGFFYDAIDGEFGLKDGIAHTDRVLVNGTAADVEIKGDADLLRHTLDQHLFITPKLSSSLPVLAGWIISPGTGLIVWLANKIFQPALKVVTGIEYSVTGPMDHPVIVKGKQTEAEVPVDKNLPNPLPPSPLAPKGAADAAVSTSPVPTVEQKK